MKDNQDQICERADELISLLYGELGEQDERAFRCHLQECARCEFELAGFGQIRESIISWRDESLGAAWARASASDPKMPSGAAQFRPRPSALAALRGFFNLSPLWMKGAAAFAAGLFCVCAIIAVAHFREKPRPIVQTPSQESSDQLKAQVAALQKKLAEAQVAEEQNNKAKDEFVKVDRPVKVLRRNAVVASAGNIKASDLSKPLTLQERKELAADLGLLSSRAADDLDLITDTISRAP